MINKIIARPVYMAELPQYPDVAQEYWAYGDIEAATKYFNVDKGFSTEEFSTDETTVIQ
jgi:hypothetical protein